MGWGELHGKGTGDFPFRARWQLPPDGSGIRRTKTAPGFATKEAAKAYADAREEELRVDVRRGDYHDAAKGELTLDDYFYKKWLPMQRIEDKTRSNRIGEYRNHIGPQWGRTPLNQLDPFDLGAFENRVRSTLSQSLGGNVAELLRMMLEDAFAGGLLKTFPMLPKRRGRGSKIVSDARVGVVTTPAAIEGIAMRLKVPDRTLVRVKGYSGMRWGEVSGMRRGFLTLHEAAGGHPASGHYVIDDLVGIVHEHPTTGRRTFGPPKNGTKGRTVLFAPVVVGWLLEYLDTIPREQDLLFPNLAGFPHQRTKFNLRWRPAADGWPERKTSWGHRALAAAPPIHAGLVPHDLRHTLKTWLAEDGIEKLLRDDYLGHKPSGMDGVYIHPTEAMRARVPAAIQRRWEAFAAQSAPNVLPFRAPRQAAG